MISRQEKLHTQKSKVEEIYLLFDISITKSIQLKIFVYNGMCACNEKLLDIETNSHEPESNNNIFVTVTTTEREKSMCWSKSDKLSRIHAVITKEINLRAWATWNSMSFYPLTNFSLPFYQSKFSSRILDEIFMICETCAWPIFFQHLFSLPKKKSSQLN